MANNTIYQSNNRGVDTEPTTDSNNLITSGAVKAAIDGKANRNLWFGYKEPTFVSGVATLDLASVLPSNAIIRSVLAVLSSNTVTSLVVRSVNTVSESPLTIRIVVNQTISQVYGCYVLVGYDIA